MQLTPRGHRFLASARKVIASVADATRERDDGAPGLTGVLAIGVTSLVAGYYLSELFSLHVLPTWSHCRQAIAESRRQFAAVVDGLDLPPEEKQALQQWARQYARWSALGVYLGGNSVRLCSGFFGCFFRLVDKHLRKGI